MQIGILHLQMSRRTSRCDEDGRHQISISLSFLSQVQAITTADGETMVQLSWASVVWTMWNFIGFTTAQLQFHRYKCDDFKSPAADFGAPGRETNYRPRNFMLFDDLDFLDFEVSYCAAPRLLTPSWDMDSSILQKIYFSAVGLSTCIVAIVDIFNRAE